MKKRLSIILACILFSLTIPVYAEDNNDNMDSLQNESAEITSVDDTNEEETEVIPETEAPEEQNIDWTSIFGDRDDIVNTLTWDDWIDKSRHSK